MNLMVAKAAFVFAVTMLSIPGCVPAFAQTQANDEPEVSTKLKLPIVEWKDENVSTNGVVLAIHGLTLHATTLDTTARFLAEKGYPTYAIDLRGMGRWRTEPDRFEGKKTMDYSLCKSDVSKTLHALKEQYPNKPIFCMGESYGATLSVRVAQTEPQLIDGVIASSFCDKRLWKHFQWRMIPDMMRGFATPWKAYSLKPYTSKLLSTDPRVTEIYLNDPMMVHAITAPRLVKTLLENKRVKRHLDKIPSDMPLLIIGFGRPGDKPNWVPPIISKINSKRVKFCSMEKQGHLLLECQPVMHAETANVLQDWLTEQTIKKMAAQRNTARL